MTVNIKLELTAYTLSIDGSRHTIFPLIKQSQNRIIHIIVNKNNHFLCTLNQIGHESIGIINLPIVKYALLWLRIALIQSAEHIVNTLVCLLLMLLHFQLVILHR